jgi:hypothetical protein
MCLSNLFNGNTCSWLLFFIIVLMIITEDNGFGYNNN